MLKIVRLHHHLSHRSHPNHRLQMSLNPRLTMTFQNGVGCTIRTLLMEVLGLAKWFFL
jgi:hypothetical protein